VTGKPSGLDLREHKVTLPLIFALPRMHDAERRLVHRLMATPEPTDDLIGEVIAAVARAGGIDYARERALRFAQEAEGELERLAPSPARESLRASIAYVLERRR
jgi:octaprenyl-diphosphate synthase